LSLKRLFYGIGVDWMQIAVLRINCISPSALRLWRLVKGMVEEMVVWRRNVVWMRSRRFQIITAETRIHPLDKILHTVLQKEECDEKEKNDDDTFYQKGPKATKPVLEIFERIIEEFF